MVVLSGWVEVRQGGDGWLAAGVILYVWVFLEVYEAKIEVEEVKAQSVIIHFFLVLVSVVHPAKQSRAKS